MSTILDKYMNEVAMSKVCAALRTSHIPRIQEMVRIALKTVKLASRLEDDDDFDVRQVVDMAMSCSNKIDEIAADGLIMFGYEIEEMEENEDGN